MNYFPRMSMNIFSIKKHSTKLDCEAIIIEFPEIDGMRLYLDDD